MARLRRPQGRSPHASLRLRPQFSLAFRNGRPSGPRFRKGPLACVSNAFALTRSSRAQRAKTRAISRRFAGLHAPAIASNAGSNITLAFMLIAPVRHFAPASLNSGLGQMLSNVLIRMDCE